MSRKHPLLAWRKAQGLSQQSAADMVGVTKQCWQYWESAQRIPDSRHIRKLMQVTGIRPDQLYGLAA